MEKLLWCTEIELEREETDPPTALHRSFPPSTGIRGHFINVWLFLLRLRSENEMEGNKEEDCDVLILEE